MIHRFLAVSSKSNPPKTHKQKCDKNCIAKSEGELKRKINIKKKIQARDINNQDRRQELICGMKYYKKRHALMIFEHFSRP